MKKIVSVILILALFAGVLAGCGSSNTAGTNNNTNTTNTNSSTNAGSDSNTANNNADDNSTAAPVNDQQSEEKQEVKHVVAATAGRPKPFIYVDEDGRVTGYEAEVLYAVDELLEDYEFEVQTCEFAAILTGISAGIYDMGFNNLSRNPEREETYLYGDEFVSYQYTGAVVRKDDDSIKTLADFGGKKAPSKVSGSSTQLFMEQYNEEHPDNQIDLIYTTAEDLKVMQDLAAGVYDFSFIESTVFESYVEEYPELGEQLKFVGFSKEESAQFDSNPYSFYLFPRNDEGAALQQAVDGALRQLKEDGTINKIAQEYLHYDVVD